MGAKSLGRKEQKRSRIQVRALASHRVVDSSSFSTGGKEEYMGPAAGSLIAIGGCGMSSDCLHFLSE